MVSESDDDTGWIDDGDVEHLLDLVDDEIGDPPVVEHCFWYIETHGENDFFNEGVLVSSYTSFGWLGDPVTNLVYAQELGTRLKSITERDVWVFYWMANCKGKYFGDHLWGKTSNHNNHALFLNYPDEAVAGMNDSLGYREIQSFEKHVEYGQKSCQWMFGPENDHIYVNVDGKFTENVRKIKYAFFKATLKELNQQDTMEGYEFCIIPNSEGWIPTCRTRGEPSTEVEDDCDFTLYSYMLYAYEVDLGTYNRYVGFYRRVYIPNNATGDSNLYIEFQGRARSDFASSTVTNLYIAVYSDDWQERIGSTWVAFSGGTIDSGWNSYNHTFTGVPKDELYNVFIFYNDAWFRNWYQRINIKNIYIGNAQGVIDSIDNGNFESGNISPWITDYAIVASSSYYVHSGSYGCRLARYVPYTYYAAYIKQDIYVSVRAIDEITFYMRSPLNSIGVTIYYSDGRAASIFPPFQPSSFWVKRVILRNNLIQASTITAIVFTRIGDSGCTTAIDDIIIHLR
ncbi:MAG: hypothetical protein ACTSR2_14180 [Candidatus Hodarchaeales archaeon]